MKNSSLAKDSSLKRVAIIGGGFAGMNLAGKLMRSRGFEITLVDKNNYNYFPPLLYQVATGFLDVSNISYPFRKLFGERRRHVGKGQPAAAEWHEGGGPDGLSRIRFRLGELMRFDPVSHICVLSNGEIGYDFLVFAAGASTNYFGNENIRRSAIPMKTVGDALDMRNRLLQNLEQASITEDPEVRKRLLTIVVAGGGPTGVEVVGMLAELKRKAVLRDYPELRGVESDIYLVEGSPALLMQMSVPSQKEMYKALSRLGVKVKLQTFVKDFDQGWVNFSDGEKVAAESLIWAAGVIANTFEGIPPSSVGAARRMITDAYNRVDGLGDVYAIGDICLQKTDPAFPAGHPQLAQVAIQQGQTLAKNLMAMRSGKPLTPFRYSDRGTMAIVGRKKAVADLVVGKSVLPVRGFAALLIWLFIHLMSLVNFRNKFKTFYNWSITWLTGDQSLRMIVRPKGNGSR